MGIAAGLLSGSRAGALEVFDDVPPQASSPEVAGTRLPPQERSRPAPDWEAVRARFAIDRGYVHMAGFYLSSHPEPVADAIAQYRKELDANPVLTLRTDGEALARQSIVRYCAAPPAEVALTTSTTMGLGLAIHGLKLEPGAEILYTTHDHSVMERAIQYKAEASGATVRQISLYDDARPESAAEAEVLERLRGAIQPGTSALCATWVHSKNGVKLPIAAMSRVVDEANAGRAPDERVVFIVDGVHGLGVEDVDVPALGCDFFAAGTHKWMFGPRGSGILWGNARSHSRVTPVIPPLSGADTWGARMSPGGFQAFEHRWAIGRAFDFHREIGRAAIQARIQQLTTALEDGLRALPRVRLYTPADPAMSSGFVCFDVEGMTAKEVEARLLDQHRIVTAASPYTPSHARFAPGLLNDLDEVEKCVEAVASLG
jgi:selenocysteine lyase/cysteine desulfurase